MQVCTMALPHCIVLIAFIFWSTSLDGERTISLLYVRGAGHECPCQRHHSEAAQ